MQAVKRSWLAHALAVLLLHGFAVLLLAATVNEDLWYVTGPGGEADPRYGTAVFNAMLVVGPVIVVSYVTAVVLTTRGYIRHTPPAGGGSA